MEPTDHQLGAAVRVARVIDETGNAVEDARATYRLVLSQGEHRADDLVTGESVLGMVGLVRLTPEGRVLPTPTLSVLAALPDNDAVAYLRRMLARRTDDAARTETGLAGELAVVDACRNELVSFGRPDLAHGVQQVSVLDNSLGYDVLAPSLTGPNRWLEVKTSRSAVGSVFDFFLSRNEYEVGRHDPSAWALVACVWPSSDHHADILGWCRAEALRPYLPDDRNGRWTEALVRLPRAALFDGCPAAV